MVSYWVAMGLALVANGLFVASLRAKKRTTIYTLQFLETGLNIVKNTLLGGYVGAALQTLGLLRNGLAAKGWTPTGIEYWLPALQISVGLTINERGWVGLLPILASSSYTYLAFKYTHVLVTKYALMVNILLWAMYQISLKDWITYGNRSVSPVPN